MATVIVYLKSVTPYSQGKHVEAELLDKESKKDFEERTWRERMHYDKDGMVFIPPAQFANALKEAAKYLSIKIPGGGGKATFTKNFDSGVMVVDPLYLGIHKDEVERESVFVPSDGKRGGTTRVTRHFPLFHKWEGEVTFYIIDHIITKDIFERVLRECGSLIGIGRFRPRNRGYYGRFIVEKIDWIEGDRNLYA